MEMLKKIKFKEVVKCVVIFVLSILFPIEEKVVFRSFGGKQYSDNPRAISEKLHELYPEIKIVWILNKKISEVPSYVSVIKTKSFRYFYDMATMQCFVVNVEQLGFTYKRRGQKYIQTWHGDRGLKKCLYQVREAFNITDNKYTDLYMAGSDYAENFCREAFRYHGYVTKYGSPRNDIFFQCNEKDVARIKTKIGIGANTKIVLFAPTFHDNNVLAKKNEQVTVDFNRLLSALECKYGGDWVCLVRAHVCSLGLDLNISDKRIIDVTQYFDMADLLLVSDWLLSDYSSSLGDFILTGRPAVLLDFNRQNYIKSRELDVDIDKVGYKIAHNQKELEDIVNNTSLEEFSKCCDEVKKYYGVHESGEAASRICEYIKTEGDKARKKNLQ